MPCPNGCVDAASLGAGAVTTAKLGDNAVTGAKIVDGAVTNAKLANSSVTVVAGAGLSGGGPVGLGGSVTLTNAGLKSGDPAGGDLSGAYPNPAVTKLQGRPVSQTAPASGQVLTFDGSAWTPADPPAGGSGTSQNTPGTLVKRNDTDGGFAAGALTLTGKIDQMSSGGFVARGEGPTAPIPASGPGTRMMWYPGKVAFRAGHVDGTKWDDASVGLFSVAMGFDPIASGHASTAMGYTTSASGSGSTAMGFHATASGEVSTAIGQQTNATADHATALGRSTTASGVNSTAMGLNTTASGNYSTAMGANASTNGKAGAFVYGDASGASTAATLDNQWFVRATGGTIFRTTSVAMGWEATANGTYSVALGLSNVANGHYSTVLGTNAQTASAATGSFVYADNSGGALVTHTPNQFLVRASGGTVFYSNSAHTTGAYLAPGESSWDVISDRNRKEHLRPVDTEEVLRKVTVLDIPGWSYKGADPRRRHIGPTAQDFRAAFGLGTDTTINTQDMNGITLAAVQALGKRTERLQQENAALRAELARLHRDYAELVRRLERMEAAAPILAPR